MGTMTSDAPWTVWGALGGPQSERLNQQWGGFAAPVTPGGYFGDLLTAAARPTAGMTPAGLVFGSPVPGFGSTASLGLNNATVPIFGGSQPKANAMNGPPHHYTIDRWVACPAPKAFELLEQPGASAPGSPAAHEGYTPYIDLTENNPISQRVDTSKMQIVNTTLPGHRFYPGTVTLQVSPSFGNGSDITITGRGTSSDPLLNDAVGIGYFGSIANAIAEMCGGQSVAGSLP